MRLASKFVYVSMLTLCCLPMLTSSLRATVLTFDVDPPVTNFENINQDYGDGVTSTTMPGNLQYGENGEGFTPDINVDYGPGGADPALWSTGYGDLSNILFKDTDGFDYLHVTLTAAPGYLVELHSWDMSAYTSAFSSDPTIDSVRVLDSEGAELLLLNNQSISRTGHTSFDYSVSPFIDDQLVLEFNAGNLGGVSDDIALDNITFAQRAVPEPGAVLLLLVGICGLTCRARRAAFA